MPGDKCESSAPWLRVQVQASRLIRIPISGTLRNEGFQKACFNQFRVCSVESSEMSNIRADTITWAPESQSESYELGSVVGDRYRITDFLGRGAFGTVYKVESIADSLQAFALKVINVKLSNISTIVEAKLLSQLNHPNIVRLHDFDFTGAHVYLVLQYIRGGALADAPPKRWDAGSLLDLAWQLASALEHAHERQIIHRDIKPSNVLVDQSSRSVRYLLTDFGVGRTTEGMQWCGEVAGTWPYMAPEQIRGRATAHSDLWALGVILYELMTGHRPFPGSNIHELRSAILFQEPQPLTAIAGSDDRIEVCVDLILALLSKDIQGRPGSATELKACLQPLLGHSRPVRTIWAYHETGLPVATSYEARKRLELEALSFRLWTVTLFAFLPTGLVPGLVGLAGVSSIWRGEASNRWRWIATGLGLCAFSLLLALIADLWIIAPLRSLLPWTARSDSFFEQWYHFGLTLWMVVFAYAIGLLLARRRHVQSELLALELTIVEVKRSEVLRRHAVLSRMDATWHVRLARALLTEGDTLEAAVESAVALELDPYNFEAILLHANTLLTLGHAQRCQVLCSQYLAANPQCFEIAELQTAARIRRP